MLQLSKMSALSKPPPHKGMCDDIAQASEKSSLQYLIDGFGFGCFFGFNLKPQCGDLHP